MFFINELFFFNQMFYIMINLTMVMLGNWFTIVVTKNLDSIKNIIIFILQWLVGSEIIMRALDLIVY